VVRTQPGRERDHRKGHVERFAAVGYAPDGSDAWLVIERPPVYGHDLNPVEPIWGQLKSGALANLCLDPIQEAAVYAEDGLTRIGSDAELAFAFLSHCGLKL
jgi:hypothetical protein